MFRKVILRESAQLQLRGYEQIYTTTYAPLSMSKQI